MTQETVTYLTTIGISAILAGLLTQSWAAQGRSIPMRHWMWAAWIMVLTNCLFAARPALPYWFGRSVPTVLVTLAEGIILLGAAATAGRARPTAWVGGATIAHAAAVVFFLSLEQPSHWRLVANGIVWASLAAAAFVVFRRGPSYFWRPAFSPANVLLLHALFHVARVTLSVLSALLGWEGVANGLQLSGDLEASMFTVAIYVSILVATMRQHYEELASTRVEMATLSGLLPICAWCKNVRDDAGYWSEVEEYLGKHMGKRITHGICSSCATTRLSDVGADVPPRDRPAGTPRDT